MHSHFEYLIECEVLEVWYLQMLFRAASCPSMTLHQWPQKNSWAQRAVHCMAWHKYDFFTLKNNNWGIDWTSYCLISHCRVNCEMLLTFLKTQQGLAYIPGKIQATLNHVTAMQMHIDSVNMHYNRPRFLSIVLPRPLSTWFAVLGDLCKEGNHRGEIRTSRLLLDPSFCLPIRSLKLVHKALKKNRIISVWKH